MAESGGNADAEIVAEIASEIHRFLQQFPNHYAARALVALVNREAAGESAGADERDLVLLTLAREAKGQAGTLRFGGRHTVDETV
jgi:hypothetical protein